ncbi:autotransporter assembly complex protein TamA [Vibrio mexicanus]|uniref:autotransporter assembly complex protein TamA n=1 Tax=Vibrio mexicanus TaxID=1004326 RepID=UPI00069C4DC4|nr:POTRA domain-containing protein [Vibrio mexicanus]
MRVWGGLQLVLWVLLVFCIPVQAANFKVEGISGDLKKNLELYLSVYGTSSAASIRPHQIQTALDGALNPYGYYQATAQVDRVDDHTLTLQVQQGEPVIIQYSVISISGAAKTDADFVELLQNSTIEVGEILNHDSYDQLKSQLTSLALKKGYFDFRFDSSMLEVIPNRHQANIHIAFNSGQRYRFGDITIVQSQIGEERVLNLAPFQAGEYFNQDKLAEYQMRLFDTQWFSNVTAIANWQQANSRHEAPIEVNVTAASKNIVQVGEATRQITVYEGP